MAADPAFWKAYPQPPSSCDAHLQLWLRRGDNATTPFAPSVPMSSLAPSAARSCHVSASPDTTRAVPVLAQSHPEPFQVRGSAGSGPQLPSPEPLYPHLLSTWPQVAGVHVPTACKQGGQAKANVVLTARRNGLNRREEMGTSSGTQTWTWGWCPRCGCFPERLRPAAPLALRNGPQAQPHLGQLGGRNPDGQETGVRGFGAQGSTSSGGTSLGRPLKRTLNLVTFLYGLMSPSLPPF